MRVVALDTQVSLVGWVEGGFGEFLRILVVALATQLG